MTTRNSKIILIENIWANRYPFQGGHTCFLVAEDILLLQLRLFPHIVWLEQLVDISSWNKMHVYLSFMNIPV